MKRRTSSPRGPPCCTGQLSEGENHVFFTAWMALRGLNQYPQEILSFLGFNADLDMASPV
ncbi:MAG: hypothetical protein HXS48_14170 [Theionarchaea archaeon]|nr:hypothetical protein [Theionarchaea archaeon]